MPSTANLDVDGARIPFRPWRIALRCPLTPGTIKTYGDGVHQYLAWAEANNLPPMVKANLTPWVAGLLDKRRRASHRPDPTARGPQVRHVARGRG